MEKTCGKCAKCAGSFLILVNNPKQPLDAINSSKNKILKEHYQKPFKKFTLFFLWNPVAFNGQTSDQSLFRLRNKFEKIPLLVLYYLTKFDDVI